MASSSVSALTHLCALIAGLYFAFLFARVYCLHHETPEGSSVCPWSPRPLSYEDILDAVYIFPYLVILLVRFYTLVARPAPRKNFFLVTYGDESKKMHIDLEVGAEMQKLRDAYSSAFQTKPDAVYFVHNGKTLNPKRVAWDSGIRDWDVINAFNTEGVEKVTLRAEE